MLGLLQTLGVNGSLFVQLGIFLFAFLFVYFCAARPYFAAYMQRHTLTVGNQDAAERILSDTEALKQEYEKVAQAMNSQFRAIYDTSRAEAMHEYDRVVTEAKLKAKGLLESNRQSMANQIESARKDLKRNSSQISQAIVTKLLS